MGTAIDANQENVAIKVDLTPTNEIPQSVDFAQNGGLASSWNCAQPSNSIVYFTATLRIPPATSGRLVEIAVFHAGGALRRKEKRPLRNNPAIEVSPKRKESFAHATRACHVIKVTSKVPGRRPTPGGPGDNTTFNDP